MREAPGAAGGPGGGQGGGRAINWIELRRRADAASASAYAPYSGLKVGAAGLTADGTVLTGCNVENASYGLTLCAECNLVGALVGTGGGRLVAIAVTAGDGRPLAPCGRCRQVLIEHGGPGLLVDGGPGHPPVPLGELLPGAFEASEIEGRRPGSAERAERAERPAKQARSTPRGATAAPGGRIAR